MLLGNGIKGDGGCVLLYRSTAPLEGKSGSWYDVNDVVMIQLFIFAEQLALSCYALSSHIMMNALFKQHTFWVMTIRGTLTTRYHHTVCLSFDIVAICCLSVGQKFQLWDGASAGWEFEGLLCKGSDTKHGAMYECPVLVAPSSLPIMHNNQDEHQHNHNHPPQLIDPPTAQGSDDAQQASHVLFMSPDAPINPVLYWVGQYNSQQGTFDLENARGPFR